MKDLIFRDAKHSDLKKIVEIYNSTISSRMVTADLEPVTIESKEQWFHEHNDTNRPLWMIEDQHQIIGWVSFQSFYGRPAYNLTVEISIYLDVNFRGKGYGKQILDQSIQRAAQLGIKTLLGFIFAHNQPSINLFKAFGFQEWANLPNIALLDGNERSLMIMGKRISE